jgi:putative mRNA 3-end processing factor
MEQQCTNGRQSSVSSLNFHKWLRPESAGLYCEPGDFYIDPNAPADRAVITHAHSDHARPGNSHILATSETLDIMKIRLGSGAGQTMQPLRLGETLKISNVNLTLAPAGHILGSAQVVIDYGGERAVISGDYKRQPDTTCLPFEPVTCDLFVTEATFGLPVFKFGAPELEINKLLASLSAFPERTHQVGVYGLGKCQRIIMLLRQAGFDRPIWLHGALRTMSDYYAAQGMQLGDLRSVSDASTQLAGEIALCPPSALGDRWSRRFADPVASMASGWMQVRGRARQRNIEFPIVISDHADWPDLLQTISDTGAQEIWVTHGREEALVYATTTSGLKAKALSLVGRDDDNE